MSIFERRQKLHNLYAQHSGLVDASRLAYLHPEIKTFSKQELARLWEQGKQVIAQFDNEASFINHLYIHVPFCKSICSFCNYERLRPSSKDALDDYTDRLIQQIVELAPSVRHLKFSSIYFGGGTPSVLSAENLDSIVSSLEKHICFAAYSSRHMEFDPAVMNAKKLEVMTKHGFDNFSFGVQSLNAAVNQNHNRGAQSRSLIGKRMQELQSSNIENISCDILLGLEGTTPQQMKEEIEELLQNYRFHRIDIFLLTPTKEYVELHFNGSWEKFWAHIKWFEQECIPHIPQIAKQYNYDCKQGEGHTIRLKSKRVLRKKTAQNSYCPLAYAQKAPLNLLGLGPSARSVIYGTAHYQTIWNEQESQDWVQKGAQINLQHEALYQLCLDLRDSNIIDQDLFHKLYHASFESMFPLAAEVWEKLGLWRIKGRELHPQNRLERTKTLMWLVDEARIEEEISRHFGSILHQQNLYHLLSPIREGQSLPAGSILQQIKDRQIILRFGNEYFSFRVAHGWTERDSLRFIPEQKIPENLLPQLHRDIQVLRKLSLRNLDKTIEHQD